MGCGSSTNKKPGAPVVTPPPANAFLPYYSLAALGASEAFGPFLLLRSYEPESGAVHLSALVLCTESAQAKLSAPPGVQHWLDSDPAPAAANPSQRAAATDAGELLFSWRNWRFWRFTIKSECDAAPQWLRYQINLVPEHTFTVSLPGRGQPWSWAFYSCNGLDNPANKDATGGLQPLWGDVMSCHAQQPLHAMIGGGDQLYNDSVFEGPLLKGWDQTLRQADTADKVALPFSEPMRREAEEFYFCHYCVHFSQPVYAQALASIPSVNVWDDHDVFDGWGSYPERIQRAPVLQGVFTAAQLFYLLFQQHTRPELLQSDGFWSGTSALHRFGDSTAVVLPDTRTFRTINQICPPAFYEELQQRLMSLPGSVRHVVLVLTVPLVWPKPDITDAVQLLSNAVTRDKLVADLAGSTGLMAQLPLRFGQAEVLDDLRDHWDAREHAGERGALLRMMMALAEEKGFRFTLLSGDVHCAGYGMVHGRGGTPPAEVPLMSLPGEDALATDPRFIPQIVSSAIVNVPPPTYVLQTTSVAGAAPAPLLEDCVVRLVPLHRPLALESDLLLRGERNWCRVSHRADGNDGGGGGGGGGPVLVFSLRCEKELGSGRVSTYTVEVPPLRRR